MGGTDGSERPLVRPEFGPTLPALLHERFRIAPWVTLGAVVAILAVAGVGVALGTREDPTVELVHRAEPAFTLLYSAPVVQRVAPRSGELVRLQARRDGLRLSVTVRPLRLPPYDGVATGVLPIYAGHHLAGLRRRLAGFELRDEGKARVNDVPGYQLGFRAGDDRRRIHGRDVLLVPDQPGAREGVLLSLLQSNSGGLLDSADLRMIKLVKSAFRSFRFGTERP